jgi:hypothetical protein
MEQEKGNLMREVLYFDAMLTPKIITFVYWLMLVMVALSGLTRMYVGGITFVKFVIGLAMIAAGAAGARISCEILIVIFKIHENIRTLAEKD